MAPSPNGNGTQGQIEARGLTAAAREPVTVSRPVNKHKRRILPSKLAMVDPHESDRRLSLFSPARHSPDGQLILPGFGVSEHPSQPALPLAWYDLGELPQATNQSAPLALRILVEGCAAVRMADRALSEPIALSVTLREFLSWLYPGHRPPRPAEYWPRLVAAAEALASNAARFPWDDPVTGRGGMRSVVTLRDIPRGPGALDDLITVIVDLPPGSGPGPILPESLRSWGIKSAPAYRLLLNLAFTWHEPGRTHAPVGKGRARQWKRSYDPSRYPLLGDAEAVGLAYPTSTTRDRRVLANRTRGIIKRLDAANELQVVEADPHNFRLLPPNAPATVPVKSTKRKPPGLVEGEEAKRAHKPKPPTVAEMEQLDLDRMRDEYGL